MRTFVGALLLALCGCEGSIAGPRAESPADPTLAPKVCNTRGQGSSARMRLLWRAAYLTELSTHLGAGAATAAASVGLSPATDKRFTFESAGSLLTDASIESLANTADAVAVWSLSSDAIATQIYGCNARSVTGAAAETCFAAFTRSTGQRLLRRAMTDAEVDDTVAFFRAEALEGQSDGTQEGFRQGLASLLMHPDFLWVRDRPVGDTAQLDAFSVAARVSFALTGQGPDAALFAAAGDGTLLNDGVLDAQVARLLETPAARARSKTFFRQWLRYDGWSMSASPAFLDGVDATSLHDDATAELDAFIDDETWVKRTGPSALLTSRATTPLTPTLARIYEAAPGATELPSNRAGLLTRVGLLASGTDDWHVVARGLTVAQTLLCRDIPPPTINVADAIRQAEALRVSNAERIATVTASTSCSGCHRVINPAGAARSDFDALGRFVTTEKHFAGGTFAFEVPAVATADLTPVLGKTATAEGSVSLSNLLSTSPEYERCFSTQYVRAVMGRADSSDECLAFDGAESLAQGGSMVDAMRAVMRSPDFLLWKD